MINKQTRYDLIMQKPSH